MSAQNVCSLRQRELQLHAPPPPPELQVKSRCHGTSQFGGSVRQTKGVGVVGWELLVLGTAGGCQNPGAGPCDHSESDVPGTLERTTHGERRLSPLEAASPPPRAAHVPFVLRPKSPPAP